MHQVTLAEMSFVALFLIVVDDYDAPLYRVSLSENLVQASCRQFTPEAVCCRLQTCFDMREIYTVPVHQVLPPDKLTQASYKLLMPEAVCCCLQTCKCGFYIRVVLCTSVPSLIVRNANTTKL